MPGDLIPNKKLSYESPEFGTISQKGIIEILMQVFGAYPSQSRREKRKLVFNLSKLERLGKMYDLSIEIKVGQSVTDVTDVTDIGLDKHLKEQPSGIETQERRENDKFYNSPEQKDDASRIGDILKEQKSPVHLSQVSQVSPTQEEKSG